ncbi:exosortase C-terminal domain/associated protein EpsI [Roseisolibacter sp. H3M3-2]|uniref:exosortase C-terminal domain/associated protein EpsI n=1 Tax=Roseisolibacter sp. H3M3-2 TaxID=3031323 RepID=UPI0023DBC30B|nr:exosortase C-terminal domain/associated protein EpsI [Roseisolibacter sp. H3M3-2]MDF1502504.1 EpsI family protein [Roseisolibacter sp. H3M3-2]
MRDVLQWVPVALLGAGCLLLNGMREQHQMPARAEMRTITVDAPGYTATDVTVPEEERRVAGMTDYVMRSFQRDSLDPGFSVYVGYYDYQVQGKTIHSPKNCLPGAGWEAVEAGTRTVSVDGRPAQMNRYLLANKGSQALVYYWYQGRGRLEWNEYQVKWNLLRDAAVHGRTEEALVRIVVPIGVADRTQAAQTGQSPYVRADSIAMDVARQLVPRVDRAIPVGPTA